MNQYSRSQSLEIDLQIYTVTDLYIKSQNPDHEHFKYIINLNYADLNSNRIHFTHFISLIHFQLELSFMQELLRYKLSNNLKPLFSYWEDLLLSHESLTPDVLDHELSNLYYRQIIST